MTKITRDEIMAMTPEQLRIAIAKAKGWIDAHRCPVSESVIGHDINSTPGYVPNYPVDIAAALGLVEEITANKIKYAISIFDDKDGVSLTVFRKHDTFIQVDDQLTLSLAICRAWLIWKLEAE